MTVHTGFVVAQTRDVKPCLLHRFAQNELFSKQGRRVKFIEIVLSFRIGFAVIDPRGMPITLTQKRRLKPGCLAPLARFTVFIPDANLPIGACGRGQRHTLVQHLSRLTGHHLVTVPLIPPVGLDRFEAGGGNHLVGCLFLPPHIGLQCPTESWLFAVDPQWVGQVLTSQIFSGQCLGVLCDIPLCPGTHLSQNVFVTRI